MNFHGKFHIFKKESSKSAPGKEKRSFFKNILWSYLAIRIKKEHDTYEKIYAHLYNIKLLFKDVLIKKQRIC